MENAAKLGYTPPAKKYVILHAVFGVYLGTGVWSKVNPGQLKDAQCYEEGKHPHPAPPPGRDDPIKEDEYKLVEVVPNLPGDRLSNELAGVHMLPGWGQ